MLIKIFEGATLQDAVRSVKKVFGKEAIIISTKRKASEGTQSPGIYEVTAGLTSKERGYNPLNEKFTETLTTLNSDIKDLTTELHSRGSQSYFDHRFTSMEYKLEALHNILLTNFSKKGEQHLKESHMKQPLLGIYQILTQQGIHHQYIVETLDYTNQQLQKESKKSEKLNQQALKYTAKFLAKDLKILSTEDRFSLEMPPLQIFIGHYGCGKTAALIKYALWLKKQASLKIALLHWKNPYVLGGEEILKIYSKISDFYFFSIENNKDLRKVLTDHPDIDFFLCDTNSVSAKKAQHLDEFRHLLSSCHMAYDLHLVLAATEHDEQLMRLLRTFHPLGISSLIFSKLDESWQLGCLYNITKQWNIPISFFSTGVNIPNDFEIANRSRVIQYLLNIHH